MSKKKEITTKMVPKDNPYIKSRSSDGKKTHAWVAINDNPSCVCVSTSNGPQYILNLKSLLAALKANNLI